MQSLNTSENAISIEWNKDTQLKQIHAITFLYNMRQSTETINPWNTLQKYLNPAYTQTCFRNNASWCMLAASLSPETIKRVSQNRPQKLHGKMISRMWLTKQSVNSHTVLRAAEINTCIDTGMYTDRPLLYSVFPQSYYSAWAINLSKYERELNKINDKRFNVSSQPQERSPEGLTKLS